MQDIVVNKVSSSIPKNWDSLDRVNEEQEIVEDGNKKHSFFFKFFLFSIIILLLAAMYAGFTYYQNKNSVSSENILITSDMSEYTDSGSDVYSILKLENKNLTDLQNVTLNISYQKGIGQNGEVNTENRTLIIGNLLKNSVYSTSTVFKFLGEEGAKFPVNMTLEYKVVGSNATFSKTFSKEVKISRAQVTLKIDSADTIIADHDITLNINIKNISNDSFSPTNINVVLPNNFIYKKEDGVVGGRNPSFKVSDLKVGEEKDFAITGYFKDSIGLTKTFRVYATEDNAKDANASFASDQHEIAITDYPVSTALVAKVNNSEVSRLTLGKDASFSYNVTNITDGSLDYVSVKFAFSSGEKITFDSVNTPELARLTPNMKSKLEFILPNISQKNIKIVAEVYAKFKGDSNTLLLKAESFDLASD